MEPIVHIPNWRWRVFKRDGSWRIRISVDGEPWGAIPMLFASAAEAWAFLDSTTP